MALAGLNPCSGFKESMSFSWQKVSPICASAVFRMLQMMYPTWPAYLEKHIIWSFTNLHFN